jgi:hypothetical protein
VIPEEKQENLLPVKLALKIASKDLKIKAAGGFEHTIIYTGNDFRLLLIVVPDRRVGAMQLKLKRRVGDFSLSDISFRL